MLDEHQPRTQAGFLTLCMGETAWVQFEGGIESKKYGNLFTGGGNKESKE